MNASNSTAHTHAQATNRKGNKSVYKISSANFTSPPTMITHKTSTFPVVNITCIRAANMTLLPFMRSNRTKMKIFIYSVVHEIILFVYMRVVDCILDDWDVYRSKKRAKILANYFLLGILVCCSVKRKIIY